MLVFVLVISLCGFTVQAQDNGDGSEPAPVESLTPEVTVSPDTEATTTPTPEIIETPSPEITETPSPEVTQTPEAEATVEPTVLSYPRLARRCTLKALR